MLCSIMLILKNSLGSLTKGICFSQTCKKNALVAWFWRFGHNLFMFMFSGDWGQPHLMFTG